MTASTFLVLTALPEEARPLRRVLRHPDVIIATTGDGAERAGRSTRQLLSALRPRLVLFAGLAGALTRGAAPGDSRLICELRDMKGRVLRPRAELLDWARHAGLAEDVLVSAPRLVRTREDRDRTRRMAGITASGTGLVDLESAACAGVAEDAGVPWLAVCGVSDGPDDHLPCWLEDARDEDGSLSRRAVATGALLRPARIPTLLSLARRARLGSQALARSVPGIMRAVMSAAQSVERLPGSRA
jgi:adenosylhomocysteine nucleosidase